MMDGTMGSTRRTGLTRAKRIETLTLWLGLPLLLLLLSLTAGIVNYTPVRSDSSMTSNRPGPAEASPAEQAPSAPTIPVRRDRLVPIDATTDDGPTLHLEDPPALG